MVIYCNDHAAENNRKQSWSSRLGNSFALENIFLWRSLAIGLQSRNCKTFCSSI